MVDNYQIIELYNIAKYYNTTNLKYVKNELFPIYFTPDNKVDKELTKKIIDIDKACNELDINITYTTLYENDNFPNHFKGINDFVKWLNKHNFAFLPNGSIFDQNKEDAIMSTVIADVMNNRDMYKNKMKDALKEYNKTKDIKFKELSEVMDMCQKAVKVINNACFTEDTEVITLDGIKNIKDVKIGDKLWNFNPKTREMEIDTVSDTIIKDYDDTMYHISIFPFVDFKVTKDHKFVVVDNKNKIFIKTIEQIYKSNRHYYLPDLTNNNNFSYSSYAYKDIDYTNIVNDYISKGCYINIDSSDNKFITYGSGETIELNPNYIFTKRFTGKVYCITTEKNHTLMAGRNGCFSLTHNCYGTTANEKFRLFNLNVAESITTTGQVVIRSTRHIANKLINKLSNTKDKDYVVTIDTDSIICTYASLVDYDVTENDPNKLEEIANWPITVQKQVNTDIVDIVKNVFYKNNVNDTNNYLYIKNEWLANSGLFVAKKNYVIHQVFKEGIPYIKTAATGISIKRSSTPKVIKPFLQNIVDSILAFKSNNEVNDMIIKECNNIKNKYSIRDIALPTSIKEEYANVPIQLRGANIWNTFYAKSELNKIHIGKVKYIYVKSWDILTLNANKEYVISIPDNISDWDYIKDKIVVDYDKMKERLIIKPVTSFYDAMGWEFPLEATCKNNKVLLKAIANNKNKSSNKIKLI